MLTFAPATASHQLTTAEGSSNDLVALDCGAGVGRVTLQLLSKYFGRVDLVEPCHAYVPNL